MGRADGRESANGVAAKAQPKLKIIYVDKIPFVPRTEAIRLGFITA